MDRPCKQAGAGRFACGVGFRGISALELLVRESMRDGGNSMLPPIYSPFVSPEQRLCDDLENGWLRQIVTGW